jgi:hypothetical protein
MGFKFQHYLFFHFFWDFFENFSILEVEIGRNKLGILGARYTWHLFVGAPMIIQILDLVS